MATINLYIYRIQHNITVHYTDQYHSMYLARSCSYLVPVSEIGRYVQRSLSGTELIQTSVKSTKTKETEL